MLLRLINRLEDAIPKKWSQADDFKRRMQRQLCADLGNAVGDEKRLERPCTRNKFLPALVRENGVRDEARHGDGARFSHALCAVYQRPARLNLPSGCRERVSRAGGERRVGGTHKVIHEHHVSAFGVAVSDPNAAVVAHARLREEMRRRRGKGGTVTCDRKG
jgi:hypothetical protein